MPQLNVLHEDNHLLVINKPPGLLAQADKTGDMDVLTLGKGYIKTKYNKPGNVFLGLVHRLDRPASGLMVLARTSKAAQRLTDQFKQRAVDKRYFALVHGAVPPNAQWEDYIAKQKARPRIVSTHNRDGKYASLEWKRIAVIKDLSLVIIKLHTGRPHQIRLQFSSRGFPLLGDFRYGSTRALDGRNLALHSYHLGLIHPTQKKPLAWQALPPQTWPLAFRQALTSVIQDKSFNR